MRRHFRDDRAGDGRLTCRSEFRHRREEHEVAWLDMRNLAVEHCAEAHVSEIVSREQLIQSAARYGLVFVMGDLDAAHSALYGQHDSQHRLSIFERTVEMFAGVFECFGCGLECSRFGHFSSVADRVDGEALQIRVRLHNSNEGLAAMRSDLESDILGRALSRGGVRLWNVAVDGISARWRSCS
jgi:hypothetical protein